jgi:hypothetical protein
LEVCRVMCASGRPFPSSTWYDEGVVAGLTGRKKNFWGDRRTRVRTQQVPRYARSKIIPVRELG